MSGFYGEDLAAVHASGFTDLARAAADEARSRLTPPCRIVEFGYGDGTTARQLCDAGHHVHGFDVSEAMIRLADVLAQLRRHGFTARTVRPGYGKIALPRGLTAYMAERKR